MREDSKSEKINYIESLYRKKFEDRLTLKINSELKNDDLYGINIGLLEVQVLNFLIKALEIKKVVEIGTLYGYSAYQVAKCLPAEGKIWSIEKNQSNYNKAKEILSTSNQKDKIELIYGDAQQKLSELQSFAPFDMVFIDANKGAYLDYLIWAKDHLKKGGVVVGDNSFLFGTVYDQSEQNHNMSVKNITVMKEFNEHLVNSTDFETMVLPTPEGLTVGLKI